LQKKHAQKNENGVIHPPKFREDEVNRLAELNKKNHPEEFQTVSNAAPKGYSPPKVNRDVAEKLKELTRRNPLEKFPDRRKPLLKGYPVNPPGNSPLSWHALQFAFQSLKTRNRHGTIIQ